MSTTTSPTRTDPTGIVSSFSAGCRAGRGRPPVRCRARRTDPPSVCRVTVSLCALRRGSLGDKPGVAVQVRMNFPAPLSRCRERVLSAVGTATVAGSAYLVTPGHVVRARTLRGSPSAQSTRTTHPAEMFDVARRHGHRPSVPGTTSEPQDGESRQATPSGREHGDGLTIGERDIHWSPLLGLQRLLATPIPDDGIRTRSPGTQLVRTAQESPVPSRCRAWSTRHPAPVTWNTSESGRAPARPPTRRDGDNGTLGAGITSPTLTSDLVMGVGSTVATTDDPRPASRHGSQSAGCRRS